MFVLLSRPASGRRSERISPLSFLLSIAFLISGFSLATSSVAYAAKDSTSDAAQNKTSTTPQDSGASKRKSDDSSASSSPSTNVLGVGASTVTQFKVSNTDGGELRVRSAPSLVGTIVGRLPEGTVISLAEGVAVEADGERWLPIVADKTKGWSAARYLSRTVNLKPTVRELPKDAAFADRVTALAESKIGQPYLFGGNGPGGFDCSGFVQWVFGKNGVSLPRTVSEQVAVGKKVSNKDIKPGDLLFFTNTYTSGLSHIGIYLGANQFVHAADEARGVTISDLKDEYWEPRFLNAARLK
jgi:cell wall-associated NlpC family hydrolase